MANKSFIVQYIIKARDKFSAAAAKVSKSSDKMKQSIAKASHAMVLFDPKIKKVKSSLLQTLPVVKKMKENWRQLRTQIELTKSKFSGITESMTAVRNAGLKMTAAITLPIALLFNSFVKAASDAQETRSKFAAVFKDITTDSERAADSLATNFGLSGTASRKMLGDTADLLTGFGFSQKGALDLATQVNELAVDLASFTNFSGGTAGASAALTKALLGERESVKSLGIAILEKDVMAKVGLLVSQGQRFASLRQAKAAATLAIAIEQSKNAIGDFARTQGDLANQQRITSARIEDMKESFGNVLLPAALRLTKGIRKLAGMLTELSPSTKKVIVVIATIAAVIGPILLLVGLLGLAIPVLAVGFTALGTAVTFAFGPIGIAAMALALIAVIVIRNWDKVRAFFSGFAAAINEKFGPALQNITARFNQVALIVSERFGPSISAVISKFKIMAAVVKDLFAELSVNMNDFSNLGQFVGDIIGGALDIVVRALLGIGEIIGQIMGAVFSGDFSNFDIGAIKAEFLGEGRQAPASITNNGRVDVGVNVGLAPGLQETAPAQISSAGTRRADVGVGATAL